VPARRELLEALVQEHIRQHGDPRQSLARPSSTASVRALSASNAAHPEVQAYLSTIDCGVPPPPGPPPPSVPAGPSARFRVVHLHAKGGLGQVSLAHDQELQREVALKEIQPQFADDHDSRTRFLLEAEITGRLEHPGIVPVYSLGHHGDGRPYYAMRFIQGETLEEAIRRFHAAVEPRTAGERALALRQLLTRFVAVCNAVGYAHARGVLHRDLKPANVMLGPYGETLVVDWGLAKPMDRPDALPRPAEGTLRPQLGSDATPTQRGAVLGTPSYMSPEQAAGQLDTVGPASDVYGLGAILYAILTGKAPVEGGDIAEMLYRVRKGEILPPRKVKREIPAGLEAICLQAMALGPKSRYPTPRDLADEVERWLADEPIRAYREPVLGRAGRWARRNRTLVSGLTALLLTAVVTLSGGLVLLGNKQRETERARSNERRERERADQNAQRADEQRALALDTLKAVVEDIQGRLQSREDLQEPLEQEGIRELRKELLHEGIRKLRGLAANAATSTDADRCLIRARLDMGDILLLDGRFAEALREYDAGHALARRVASAAPRDDQARRDLCLALKKRGDASVQLTKLPAALALYRDSLRLAERLARERPLDPRAQRDLYDSLVKLGDVLRLHGADEAARVYARALETAGQLIQLGVGAQRELALVHARVGEFRFLRGDLAGALEAFQKARAQQQTLTSRQRGSARTQRDLTLTWKRIGDVHLKRNDPRAALKAYRAAHQLTEELAQRVRVPPQVRLAQSYESLAEAHERGLDHGAARDACQKGLAVLEALQSKGQLPAFGPHVALKARLERRRAACDEVVKVLDDLEFADSVPPARAAALLMMRGRVLAARGRHADAADAGDRLARLTPAEPLYLYDAACCCSLAVAAVAPGKKPQALTGQERGLRDGYANKAIDYLRKAREAGWFKVLGRVEHARKDPDLDAIRDREGFQQLLAP
jgi:serine/threonine-protein kinase